VLSVGLYNQFKQVLFPKADLYHGIGRSFDERSFEIRFFLSNYILSKKFIFYFFYFEINSFEFLSKIRLGVRLG
jgi:hypothetical protein